MPVTKTKKKKKKIAKRKPKILDPMTLKVPATFYRYVDGKGWVAIPNTGIRVESGKFTYQIEARRPMIGEHYCDVWYPPNDLVTKDGKLKERAWKTEAKYWNGTDGLVAWDDYQNKQKIPPERVLITVTLL
jgi:hypothetical protein